MMMVCRPNTVGAMQIILDLPDNLALTATDVQIELAIAINSTVRSLFIHSGMLAIC